MELNKQITFSYILNKLKDTGNASSTLISDEFNQEKEYLTGEYCIKDNALYIFTSDKSAGEWDESKAEPTSIGSVLSEQNKKLGSLKIGLNDEGTPGYYLPDGTFKPFIIVSTFNEFVSNVSSSSTSASEVVLAFNGECKFNEELFVLSLNKDFVTINKDGKYRVTIDAKLYINSSAEASCYLKKNGKIILGKSTSSAGQGGGYTYPHFTGEFDFVKGDTLVFYAKFAGWSGNKAGCNAGSELLLDYIS